MTNENPGGAVLVIREATDEDVAFLAGVQVVQMHRERPEQDVETLRSLAVDDNHRHIHTPQDGCTLSVIELDGHPAGRLRVARSSERLFLAGIQIAPSERNRGIGTAVIGRLVDEARAAGLPLQLRVDRANVDAQRLYTRLGFEQRDESDTEFLMERR